jgi:putative ABC transport system permease protein
MIYYYAKSFLKNIQKNRFFYAINLIGFLAGFLVLTIIFTFVYQELNFDKFHKNRSDIYRIHSGGYGVTPLCFGEKIKNRLPEVNEIVRFSSKNLILDFNNKEVEIGKVYYTDPEIFQVFSFKLIMGNTDNVLDAPFSIVINQSIANQLYGSRSPLGETIRDKDGTVYTISGVMEGIPYNSHIQSNAFLSIETLRITEGEDAFNCGSWGNLTYLRMGQDSNLKETEAKLNTLLEGSKMRTSDGEIPLQLQSLRKIYFDYDNNKFDGSTHGNLQTVILYFAISILILLIVIINYINLSTAISGNRIKEITIQKVNGAKRIQIIKQFLFESIGVVVITFVIALLMIELFLPQVSSLLNLSISSSFNRSFLYLYFLVGVVCIGLITGLFPGVFLSNINVIKVLKNDSVFNSRGIQRKLLLVFQMIIVAVLLNCTFIINKQIDYIFKKDLGFQ